MKNFVFIFIQLLIGSILFGYLQHKYLNYCSQYYMNRKIPIQKKYYEIQDRVLKVDQRLKELNESFQYQNSVYNNYISSSGTSKMIHLNRIVLATQLLQNIPKPCGDNHGSDLVLVVLIYNRIADYKRRQVIRNTFGSALNKNPLSRFFFVLGKLDDERIQSLIELEQEQYQDIIQFDFIENYFNCTLKAIAITRWVSLYCPFAKFILKFDDDGFIRATPLIEELLLTEPSFIMGRISIYSSVYRTEDRNKWSISPKDYPYKRYPIYIVGVFLIPAILMIQLYEAIVSEPLENTIPALPFDDVYLTGIVAQKAMIARRWLSLQHFLGSKNNFSDDLIFTSFNEGYYIIWNSLSAEQIQSLWKTFGPN